MQLENGPAATRVCDTQEQEKQSRMLSGCKKIILNAISIIFHFNSSGAEYVSRGFSAYQC